MGKGVASNSSKSYTVQSTFTCEDCALHYSTVFHCFIRVDGPVRILAVEDSWIMDCTLGIQVEPPTSTKSCTFFCSMPLSRRHFSTRPMELRSSPCKAPRSVLETTTTVVDALGLYSTSSTGLMDLFGTVVEQLLDHDCTLGIQVELLTITKSCMFLLDAFVSQAPFHEAHELRQ